MPAAQLFGGGGRCADRRLGADLLFSQAGNDTLLGKGGNDQLSAATATR
jgi:Ca2+-binding RTX toxin-like protein